MSTKIINVQRSDSFEELLDLFVTAQATEVIFIVPRGTVYANHSIYFEKLAETGKQLSKKISIVTTDPFLVDMAVAFDFNVLHGPNKPKVKTATAVVENQVVDLNSKTGESIAESTADYSILPAEDFSAELAAARNKVGASKKAIATPDEPADVSRPKILRDIIRGDSKARDLKITSKSEEGDSQVDIVSDNAGTDINPMNVTDISGGKEPSEQNEDEIEASVENDYESLYRQKNLASTGATTKQSMSLKNVRPNSMSQNNYLDARVENDLQTSNVKKRVEHYESVAKDDIIKLWKEEEKKIKVDKSSGGQGMSSVESIFQKIFAFLFKKTTLIILGGVIVVLALVLYMTLGSAKIIAQTKKQDINYTFSITVSNDISELDLEKNQIPGQTFSVDAEVSDSFVPSGNKDVAQKTSGTITIFNKGSKDQKLVATTRFESSGGLIFRIPESVVVPGGTPDSPGSIKSVVYADEPGNQYNIDAGSFTVPGFKGTPTFALFYAESAEAFTGGIVGPSKIVTESDYITAQNLLEKRLKDEVISALSKQAGDLTVISDLAFEINESVTNAGPNEAAEVLDMSVSGTGKVLAFREGDIISLAGAFVDEEAAYKALIVTDSVAITYTSASYNEDVSLMTFSANLTGQASGIVNIDEIRQDVVGLNDQGIKSYFNNITEIESVRVILSPIWVKRIPSDIADIEIIVE